MVHMVQVSDSGPLWPSCLLKVPVNCQGHIMSRRPVYPGQAKTRQYFVHTISLVADNIPSLIKGRRRMTIENSSRLISAKRRVKSGIFGQTAKLGQRPCLFHISNIGIKNKLTKQTVKILMRRLIRSRLICIYTVCKGVSEFT